MQKKKSKYKKVTVDSLKKRLLKHKPIELIISLFGGVISRHTITQNEKNTYISDHSYVDDSTTETTVEQYFSGWYGEAITKGAVWYDNR